MQQLQREENQAVTLPETLLLPTQQTDASCESEGQENEAQEIQRVRRWSRHPFVRPAVLVAMQRAEHGEDVQDITPLLRALDRFTASRWRDAALSAWTLGRLSHTNLRHQAAIQSLAILTDRAFQRDKKRLPRVLRRTAILSGCLAFGVAAWFRSPLDAPFPELLLAAWALIAILVAPFVMPASLISDDRATNRARAEAVIALGRLRATEYIPLLARVCHEISPRMRAAGRQALKYVLPTLTEAHYGQLSPECIGHLCGLLRESDASLVCPVLEALGKAAGGQAVSFVEPLLRREFSASIRATAERVLPILQQRQRMEQDSGILLRGASEPMAAPEQLLRAAEPSVVTPPQEMLRAVQSAGSAPSEEIR